MKGKKYAALGIMGLLLFVEHYVSYGGFDYELLGHEIYGMILIISGLLGFYWENRKNKKFMWNSKEKSAPHPD